MPAPDPGSAQREQLAEAIRSHLCSSIGHNRVRRYLNDRTKVRVLDDRRVEVLAGDSFTLDMIQRRLGDGLRIAAQFVLGTTEPTIEFTRDQSLHRDGHADASGRSAQKTDAEKDSTHPLASRIRPARPARAGRGPACPTLAGFLVGSSNRMAYESIRQTIESNGSCPPVFVHGSCGVGKTHLLRAATMHARAIRPGARVRYTTGEAFTNAFVTAIRTRTVEAFQKKYRGLDLLCIDDIHLMAGKQATQHELLQIFNTLSLGGAKIILASDAHPREISRLDHALASRFSAGLVVRVEDPDEELASRLITHIAHKRGVFLDEAGVKMIIARVGIGRGASVRDLEGAVLQTQAVARLLDQGKAGGSGSISPSAAHVHRALSLRHGDGAEHRSGPIALDTIVTRICHELTVSKSDLRGKGRQKKVVLARELIVHLARQLTSKSFPEIAHALGRSNHSTVITAAKRFRGRLEQPTPVLVGCPLDGVPACELVQMLSTRVRQEER